MHWASSCAQLNSKSCVMPFCCKIIENPYLQLHRRLYFTVFDRRTTPLRAICAVKTAKHSIDSFWNALRRNVLFTDIKRQNKCIFKSQFNLLVEDNINVPVSVHLNDCGRDELLNISDLSSQHENLLRPCGSSYKLEVCLIICEIFLVFLFLPM